ncbi:MAG: AAA family ATPase [Rhodobacteraceae bacterium]|nr:AAA family ATPase [Paracoccaceae bacterium]
MRDFRELQAELDTEAADHPVERSRGLRIITPQPARESMFRSAAELDGTPVPPRDWLVDEMVPQKTVTLFSGDGGTGKSLLALQLAVAVATGSTWIGRAVSHGRVIYLSAEDDDDELHRRLDDILGSERKDYIHLAPLTIRSLAGEDALLALDGPSALEPSSLFSELDARAAEEAPELIVIDTLADVYPANENDRAKVRQFVGILRGLAIKRKCAVLLLGHPSLTGLNSGTGTSGSTAWNNSVRSRLYLERTTGDGHPADDNARVLHVKKANYAPTGTKINLQWRDGVFSVLQEEGSTSKRSQAAKAERVFLKLLQQAQEQGRRVNHAGGQTYAPKVFEANPKSEGITKRTFGLAMEALLSAGRIRISQDGPPSKRRKFLEVAD